MHCLIIGYFLLITLRSLMGRGVLVIFIKQTVAVITCLSFYDYITVTVHKKTQYKIVFTSLLCQDKESSVNNDKLYKSTRFRQTNILFLLLFRGNCSNHACWHFITFVFLFDFTVRNFQRPEKFHFRCISFLLVYVRNDCN